MTVHLNGLANILAGLENGTLHSIRPAPDREDFATEAEYQEAFDSWFQRMAFWRVEETT